MAKREEAPLKKVKSRGIVKPRPGWVCLEVTPPLSETEGGIILLETYQGESNEAKVLAVGDGVEGLVRNDRVIFNRHVARMCEVVFGQDHTMLIKEDGIIAVLQG